MGKKLKHTCLLKKGRSVAAMFLCMSVTVIPCLISSLGRAAMQEDCIEVRVEACGARGIATQVMSLTKQQHQMLEAYFLGLQSRLNTTENGGEMRLLFREAVMKLYSYGLVPRGVSVKDAEQLMTKSYQDSLKRSEGEIDRYRRWDQKNQGRAIDNPMNSYCLFYAVARKIEDYSTNPVIVPLGRLLVFGLIPSFFALLIGQQELANRLAELGLYVWMRNPFRWFNIVLCEGYETEIRSVGLRGMIHETFPERSLFSGFTGLMITSSEDRTFFLGGAFNVYDLS